MHTAIVTGASGFVGSHLSHRLMKLGWDVHVIVREWSTLPQFLNRHQLFVHISDSKGQSLHRIVDEIQPEMVFHLASYFRAEHNRMDIPLLLESNLEFGTNLLQAMSNVGARNFVNTGTSWQHYHGASYNPVCLYAATKQAFESILKYYTEAESIRAVTLKLTDTYGPHDNRPKLLKLLQEAAIHGSTLELSPGHQLIDLVYVDDVVNAFLVAAERLLSQTIGQEDYLISSGQPVRLRDLVATVEESLGTQINVHWGARSYRKREVMNPWTFGERLPLWEPTITLKEGLRLIQKMEKSEHS